jgi:hypothetical protein
MFPAAAFAAGVEGSGNEAVDAAFDSVVDIVTETVEDSFDFRDGFEDAEVWGYDLDGRYLTVNMSAKDGRYYAYNSEFNFCVIEARNEDFGSSLPELAAFRRLPNPEEGKTADWVKTFCSYSDQLGHWIVDDDSRMLSFDSAEWTIGGTWHADPEFPDGGHVDQADAALNAAAAYLDVARWYADAFEWVGLCNDGTENALVIVNSPDMPALNGDHILFVDPSVPKAKECLADEFFRTVFRMKTKTVEEKRETAALSEGLGDVFAALYQDTVLGMSDWLIGRNLAVKKDLSVPMQVTNGETEPWPKTMDEYIDEEDGRRNSGIISCTLYNIWDQVLDRDSYSLGRVLFRCVDYLPEDPTFSQFRDAFRAAMGIWYSEETVDRAMKQFDVAKINPTTDGFLSQVFDKVAQDASDLLKQPAATAFPEKLTDFIGLGYGQIRLLPWTGGVLADWVGGYGRGSWTFAANYVTDNMDLLLYFTFEGQLEDDNESPISVFVRDYRDGESRYALDGENTTGMTSFEFGEGDPTQMMQVPNLYNRGYIEMPLDGGWLLEAYFTDPEYRYGEPFILTEAEIMRAW